MVGALTPIELQCIRLWTRFDCQRCCSRACTWRGRHRRRQMQCHPLRAQYAHRGVLGVRAVHAARACAVSSEADTRDAHRHLCRGRRLRFPLSPAAGIAGAAATMGESPLSGKGWHPAGGNTARLDGQRESCLTCTTEICVCLPLQTAATKRARSLQGIGRQQGPRGQCACRGGQPGSQARKGWNADRDRCWQLLVQQSRRRGRAARDQCVRAGRCGRAAPPLPEPPQSRC